MSSARVSLTSIQVIGSRKKTLLTHEAKIFLFQNVKGFLKALLRLEKERLKITLLL
jgi:hypothetical protein